ncbi:MAG: helix-turn-helix domain-containing protein [Spirochaetales bacterium]|nr:helix-turn-helix domain-containing protein [Leptospiraceae bacterium]MCP5480718.1 helix-turn-helix domain-containing protein [Spirochaetales bacterium]
MVLSKRVGAILREAREAKKLTVKEVARETNMTPRYIEALEVEDFSQFPGETYALGFLRNYSEYLNLDTDHLLNLYRGQKIDQSQAPLKELINPRRRVEFRLPTIPRNAIFALVGIAVLSALIYGLAQISWDFGSGGDDGQTAEAYCEDRTVMPINLPQENSPARSENLSLTNTVRFRADDYIIKLCLARVQPGDPAVGEFHMRIDEKYNYSFTARPGETVTIDRSIESMEALRREIRITPGVLEDYSARVDFETLLAAGVGPTPETNEITTPATRAQEIQVTLEFVGESYIDWYQDGTYFTGRFQHAGETLTLEARNRLEIKVGNGGGVRIIREGVPARLAGPPGKIVKIVYRRVPDPLDPTQSNVQEAVEVQY